MATLKANEKRQREEQEGQGDERAPKRVRSDPDPDPDPSSDLDDKNNEEIHLKVYDVDFHKRYVHFTYSWLEHSSNEDPGYYSALLDVTDMSLEDYEALREILDREIIAKSCVLYVNEQGDFYDEHGLSAEECAILKASKWCQAPDLGSNLHLCVKIVSFVHVEGAY